MNISIRQHIKNNFKNTNKEELLSAINNTYTDEEELALPGLGVFFEVLWNNADETLKNNIINTLEKSLK